MVAANLELARGAGSRYLVQRWGDGTMCDKTGKPREVEVQVRHFDGSRHPMLCIYLNCCRHTVPLLDDRDGHHYARAGGEDVLLRPGHPHAALVQPAGLQVAPGVARRGVYPLPRGRRLH